MYYNQLYGNSSSLTFGGVILTLFISIISIIIEIAIIVSGIKKADYKGYGSVVGFLFTFLLGLIGLIIIALLPDKKLSKTEDTGVNHWVCKNCGQLNSGEVCKNCGVSKNYNGVGKPELAYNKNTKRWICPKCGEENNGNALHCINCYEKKPD